MNNKLTIYSPPFPRMKSYYDVIDFTYEYGLKAVEPFSMFEFEGPDTENARKVREYADERGIVFPCISVYTTIADTDVEAVTQRLKGYADVAAALGSPYLHHTIVGEISNPDKVLSRRNELFEQGLSVVREVYDYAESIGVKTVYEDQGYIFNGVKGFGEFLDKVGRDVGVVADFGNIYHAGDCIEDFVNAFSDRIVHAHIKDVVLNDDSTQGGNITLDGKYMKGVEIGTGNVDCKGVIELLKSYGYDGYYAIEYATTDDNSPIIDETINLINQWL